jgi:hypothetical protein
MSRKVKKLRSEGRADRALLEAYLGDGFTTWFIQLDDLAMHDPEAFWRFLLLLLERKPGLIHLVGLGAGPLTRLLRCHPDDFDERVAGLVRRDRQMWDLAAEIDRERVAPDVYAKLEAAISERP